MTHKIIIGDAIKQLQNIPDNSIDLILADLLNFVAEILFLLIATH